MNKLLIAHNAIKSACKSQPWEEYGHQVEYLEAFGNAYISLPYVPNDKTILSAKFQIMGYTKDACPLYGARYNYSENGFSFFYYTLYSYQLFTGFGGSTTRIDTPIQLQTGIMLNILHELKGLTVNGYSLNSSHFKNFTKTIKNLVIFSIRTIDTIDPRRALARMFEYNIVEDGEVLHNIIAIKTDKKAYGNYPLGAYLPWDTITNTVPDTFGTLGGGDAI